MTQVSILLAGNKSSQHIENIVNRLNSIQTAITYEIIIMSPFNITGPNIKHIAELNSGPIAAYNKLVKYAEGEIICTLTDCSMPTPNFWNFYEQSLNYFQNRKLKVTGITDGGGHPRVPNCINITYKPSIIRFPVFEHNSLINNFGGVIFNEMFYYHVADNWLGLWCYLMGEEASELDIASYSNIPHIYINKYDQQEYQILINLYNCFTSNKNYNARI